jgi:transposase
MRGADITQESLFTVAKLDDFVPATHPLRAIRKLADTALQRMSALFDTLYADTGRASIAPEKLMRAQLLQLFYSLRSERMLMEQLGYNLLFRWFVGLAIDDPVWDHSVFSKNRDRLNAQAVAAEFLSEVVRLAEKQGLISDEHFSVDGTLLQAWASQKSFRPKDDTPDDPGRGQGLRHGRLRGRLSCPRRDTPCCAERQWPAQRHRWPYHAPRRLWSEPEDSRLDRNPLRLAQGGGRPAPGEATRT